MAGQTSGPRRTIVVYKRRDMCIVVALNVEKGGW